MFFKIIVLKMFANFIGNQLSLLITLQVTRTATLLKRDSNKFFFCEICKIFANTLFYRKSPVAAPNSFRFTVSVSGLLY